MLAALFAFWVGLSSGIGLVFNTAKACEYFQAHEDSVHATPSYGHAYGFVSTIGIALCVVPWLFVINFDNSAHVWLLVAIGMFALWVPFVIGNIPSIRCRINRLRLDMKDRF